MQVPAVGTWQQVCLTRKLRLLPSRLLAMDSLSLAGAGATNGPSCSQQNQAAAAAAAAIGSACMQCLMMLTRLAARVHCLCAQQTHPHKQVPTHSAARIAHTKARHHHNHSHPGVLLLKSSLSAGTRLQRGLPSPRGQSLGDCCPT